LSPEATAIGIVPPVGSSYLSLLESLTSTCPRLARPLDTAERTRTARLALMGDGARLAGLNELLVRLDDVAAAWDDDPGLAKLAFLIRRAIGDYETAIEAGLSGFPSVACDSMRDVMEIENLLLDFFIEPTRADEWLAAERGDRLRRFSPAAVRRRILDSTLAEVTGTEKVASDYAAHSEAIHPAPGWPPIAEMRRGHVETAVDDYFAIDISFVEMYEHGRRLGNAVLLLSDRVSPGSLASQMSSGALPAFSDGHQRTQEYLPSIHRPDSALNG
jgi:hypothetical protein